MRTLKGRNPVKRVHIYLVFFICLMLITWEIAPGMARAGEIPTVGSYLPKFQLEGPAEEKERAYLGIGKDRKFSISQVDSGFVLVEIVGVYCPQCHIQAPLFNKLFQTIQKDTVLNRKVKMLAIAVGANPMESAHMKKELHVPFPILVDQKFEIHKLLGEPRTPFTMLIDKNRKVIYVHLGIIQDMDQFFTVIQKAAQ